MSWVRIEGNWKQLKGKAQVRWGRLTDNHREVVAGRRAQLVGHVQERYGLGSDEAVLQVEFFDSSFKEEDIRGTSRRAGP